jgi:hypothetical protein
MADRNAEAASCSRESAVNFCDEPRSYLAEAIKCGSRKEIFQARGMGESIAKTCQVLEIFDYRWVPIRQRLSAAGDWEESKGDLKT